MKKVIISLISVAVLIVMMLPAVSPSPVSAADTGAAYPGTVNTNSQNPYDDNDWTSPGDVDANDGNYASITTNTFDSPDYSYVLRATDFGFSIPAGNTITGIKVEIERRSDWVERGRDALVQLTKDGSARVGDNKATTTEWPTSAGGSIATYGGETDLWGTTWTLAEINSSNFGVHLAAQATNNDADIYVDFIRITVYYTPPPVPNPPLTQSCGLDIVLVMDESSSVDSAEFAQMQAALEAFVDALSSTPTQFALVDFGTVAYLRSGFTSDYAAIKTLINNAKLGGTQYTNWQQGLLLARGLFPNRDNPDLIIFASDGNPTAYGNPATTGTDSTTMAAALAAAIPEANAAKNAGIRILTIGIGDSFSGDPTEQLNIANLIDISGPIVSPPASIGTDVDVITTDFAGLAGALADLVNQLCGGTITVHKIIDCDGDLNTIEDQSDGGSWTFTANVDSPGSSIPPSGDTDSGGLINFDIDFGGQCDATVSIVETLEPGFELLDATCTDATYNGLFDGTDSIDGIVIDSNDIVTCTFYNRPLYSLTVISDGCCPIDVSYGIVTDTVPAGDSKTYEDIPCGTDVTVSADDSSECCDFVNWSGDVPSGHGNDNPLTIHVDSDKSVTGHCTGAPAPVAAFNATPTSGCEPLLTVLFTDSSTGATSWSWDFTGGSPSSYTGQTPPSVSYNSPGTYDVTLTVSNDCGNDTETKIDYITVYANPTVSITPDGGVLDCDITHIELTADIRESPCKVIGYQWYKDGVALNETSDTLTVNKAGNYTVEVECAGGCKAEDTVTVTKDINLPTVNVANVVVCEGANATLTATVSGCTGMSYQWYKGSSSSGTPISGATSETYSIPDATTADAGVYTCLVECENEECKSEGSGTLTVNQEPTANFSGTPRNDCTPLTVHFTDLSTGATSWSWNFGDGGTSTLKNPSHQYAHAGTYTVSLTVRNACGSDTETKANYIEAVVCGGGGGGGGGCPTRRYLTVDWEGNNTTKPLYSNGKLAVDLAGPSPDGSNNLLLERFTHAPIVGGRTYYLIIIRELEEIPPVPENSVALVAFNITPQDAVFDNDIFLTLGLDQSQLPENALNVTLAYYDDINGVWVPLETEQPDGVAELTLSAPINHFSIFGVLAELTPISPPPPAHFVASGLNIVPSVEKTTFVTKTGESVTITANVVNDGWQSGTYTVALKLNGQTVDTKIVTLGAGQSKQVSFTQSGLDYGKYDVEVAGMSGDFTASRTITWWLIIVLIAALGLIIWGVVWGSRRRRKARQATQQT